jgi:O-antigen ligase
MTESLFQQRFRFDYVLIYMPALVVLTMLPFQGLDRFNGPKLLALSSLIFVALVLALVDRKIFSISLRKSDFLLLAFLLIAIVSTIFSESALVTQFFGKLNRDTGLLAYLLFIFVFFMTRFLSHMNAIELFVYSTLWVAIPVEIYALLQIFNLDPIEWGTPDNWIFSFLGNPNHLSSFLGIVFLLNIYLFGLRRFLIPAILNMLVILFIMFSNASFQGFLLILLGVWALLIWHIQRSKIKLTLLLAGNFILIALVAYSLFNLRLIPIDLNFLQEGTFLRRKELWTIALISFSNSPWIGHGFASFDRLFLEYRTLESVQRVGIDRTADSVHFELLELLVNGGILLALAWLALIVVVSIKLFKQIKINRTFVEPLHDPLSFLGIVFLGVVFHNLISPVSIAMNALMMLAAGLIMNYDRFPTQYFTDTASDESFGKPAIRRELIPFVVLVLILTITSFLPLMRNAQLLSSSKAGDIQGAYRAVDGFPRDADRYLIFSQALIDDKKYGDAKFVLEQAVNYFPEQPLLLEQLLKFELTPEERDKYQARLNLINPLHNYSGD